MSTVPKALSKLFPGPPLTPADCPADAVDALDACDGAGDGAGDGDGVVIFGGGVAFCP